MTHIRTLLIANRGEIACRVMRTARAMGITTVAVFSDADAEALFVREADIAVRLPGVTPADTYLRGDLIVEAALRTGADAIHPGYGFLSENAEFATAVAEAGLLFIGPPPGAIRAMGSKIRAKQLMDDVGVPVLAGATVAPDAGDAELHASAASIGYPLLVKASAGGGGRGMRIVGTAAELVSAVSSARREASAAFGDDTVFLERYVTSPRHVEVQIFGDSLGQVVHLFERDCSIQRRYQKVVEESPSPAVDKALRARLGAAAVAAGRALGYVGAGTVEFVVDQSGDFHFLEVNTRLQVEHPVTELVTGLDLVRAQLLVAQGEPLPAELVAATISGHAIEVRLYAEDPSAGFLPTSGRLREFALPDTVRVDSGFAAGDAVSIHYDPLLAKVIAHAPTRSEAALTLAGALRAARIHGVVTNRDLLVGILTDPEFLAGHTDTAYLARHEIADLASGATSAERASAALAAVLALRSHRRAAARVQTAVTPGWRNVRSSPVVARLRDGRGSTIELHYVVSGDRVDATVGGVTPGTVVRASVGPAPDGRRYRVTVETDGLRQSSLVAIDGEHIDVDGPFGGIEFTLVDPLPAPRGSTAAGSLSAPMPGTVVRLEVEPGARVATGDTILVLEAMKMEHSVRAPADGVVESVLVRAGEQVEIGQVLAIVAVEQRGETSATAE